MLLLTVTNIVTLAPVSRLPAPGKDEAMVFDNQDVGVLVVAARARQRVYGPQGE